MSEKTIPVWLHQSDTEKIQIGVAGELDPDTNAQPIEIWPEFKEYRIENFTIGDADPVKDASPADDVLTREEFRSHQNKEQKK